MKAGNKEPQNLQADLPGVPCPCPKPSGDLYTVHAAFRCLRTEHTVRTQQTTPQPDHIVSASPPMALAQETEERRDLNENSGLCDILFHSPMQIQDLGGK